MRMRDAYEPSQRQLAIHPPSRRRVVLAVFVGAATIYAFTGLAVFGWALACTGSTPHLPGCHLLARNGVHTVHYLVPALVFLVCSIPTILTGRQRSAVTGFAVIMGVLTALLVFFFFPRFWSS